jgi:hypothetical protein
VPPELYGQCRALGYCDCGGENGCIDPDGPGTALDPDELEQARVGAIHEPTKKPPDTDKWQREGWGQPSKGAIAQQKRRQREHEEYLSRSTNSVPTEEDDNAKPPPNPTCGYCRRRGSACARHGGGPSYYQPKRREQTVGDQPLSALKPEKLPEPEGPVVRPKCPKCNYMEHPGQPCPVLEAGSEFVQQLDRYFLQYWYENPEPSLHAFMNFVRRREDRT